MKKIIFQISLVLIIIGVYLTLITNVYAADSTITVSSNIKKGDKYTVTVNIPSEAVAYQGVIKVTYSDNTTDSSGVLAKYGWDDSKSDFSHPGNMTATFTAKVEGKATISVEDCQISDENSNNLNSPKSITFNIKSDEPTTPTKPTNTTSSNGTTSTTGGNSSGSGNSESNNAGNSNSGSSTTENNNVESTQTTPKFTDVNETVYITSRCNVRKSYTTSSEKITTLDEGTKLIRKSIGDNGWSKVEYNGQTAYISSQYLTTTAPEEKEPKEEVKFKNVKETVYAKQNCNLRKSWSTESNKVGYLLEGQEVERTGVGDNGWSRIKYNGNDVYVATRLLVTEKPEEIDEDSENKVNNENIVDENIVIDDVTEMTEEEKLKELQEEIGVLPEVGNNIANYIYIIVTGIAILGIISGIIYIRKDK